MNDAAGLSEAPGGPGVSPTWSSSAKDLVSTALGSSRLWATFGFGIVNEVYWPSTGQPQIRDLGFIVAGPKGWIEVKRARRYTVTTPDPAILLPSVVHEGDGYSLALEYLPHPARDILLIRYKLTGDGCQLYALLSPHLGCEPHENDAWASDDLTARRGEYALCLRSQSGFARTSAGYVGASDGWTDFDRNGAMTWRYAHAGNGNLALMGELAANEGVLALSFANNLEGARTLARSGLADPYDEVRRAFVEGWETWASTLTTPAAAPDLVALARLSAATIKAHEDRTYAGAIVASLSVPWGASHDDPGGYHLVWTRDAVEAALAMIAVGQTGDAARTLAYLIGTQAEDGGWAQNFFPDGGDFWNGGQLDEVALPLLLAAKLYESDRAIDSPMLRAMIERAVGFIARQGPMTQQDRWEENGGASPFTLAVTVCALVGAAELVAPAERDYVLSLADCWNERIESWTYTTRGAFRDRCGVEGYYVRLGAPPDQGGLDGVIPVKNVEGGTTPAVDLVGLEFLALVRSGLRRADDPRIRDTVKVIDAVLRVETPNGPSYHRYNGDGYGEKADGSAFDKTGVGRLWPLLTGERGHYEIAAGGDGAPYLAAMARMTGPGGLLPEQIWDAAPLPALGLEPGKPSGSAMPLVWAHAEFIRLLFAMGAHCAVERLETVLARYDRTRPQAERWHWRESSPFDVAPAGRIILIEHDEPFALHYGFDGWRDPVDAASAPTAFGLHGVTLDPFEIRRAGALDFTFYFPARDAWRKRDFRIAFSTAGG